jgi:sugar O-acyltransferase (sialic acid O-acetyltransferase NeuD family)
MGPLVILGAGGHGREQLDLIRALDGAAGRREVLGFIVDPHYGKPGEPVAELSILGGLDWLESRAGDVELVCAIGSPASRAALVARAEAAGASFATLVHPSATVGERVVLGSGVIVSAGAVLTCDIELGAHVHVNVGSSISHDCVLEPYATLAPGCRLAGAVRVGRGAELGVGAAVADGRQIGQWSIVGAGAVVVDDVSPDCTVVGVPARSIRQRASGWQNE